jgi:hypothetical protein
MKLVEEGPEADLSMYLIPSQLELVAKDEAPMVEGGFLPMKMNRAKMVLIVNGGLKMGKGKICAQVGHAVIGAYLQM